MDTGSAKKLAVPLMIIAIGVFLLIALFLTITGRLNDLRSSPTDNLTWTLSQVEVDILKLRVAMEQVSQGKPDAVAHMHRRFDAAFSRSDVIARSPVFASMRENPKFADQLAVMRGSFDRLAAEFDGDPEVLLAQLPDTARVVEAILEQARAVSLTGIELTSAGSDADRASLTRLLIAVEIISASVILLLFAVLIFIFLQSRATARISTAAQKASVRLKSTFDVSLDGIIVADENGVVLEFNDAAEAIFGLTNAEAVGVELADIIAFPDASGIAESDRVRIGKSERAPHIAKGRSITTAVRKSGAEFPIEISLGEAHDGTGRLYVAYLRDITRRVAAKQDLERARDEAVQAGIAKTNFLAVMSHEMRTPLNGVFGAVELLKATPLTADQSKYLDIAQQSGDILLHHVNNVLDVTRIDAHKFELVEEQFELVPFFDDIIAANSPGALTQGNDVTLSAKGLEIAPVIGDRHRLRQILGNLIGNALKFTDNGTVSVSAELHASGPQEGVLVFAVSDNGVGISDDEKDRIFERFFTRDRSYDRIASGAGLGLTICKDLVDLMGGTITVDSKIGTGSTFTVRMPIALAARSLDPAEATAPAPSDLDLDGQKILLVEDNEINRAIVRTMLEAMGAVVTEAFDGAAAVRCVKEQAFDAILMDISMPVMNGVDATIAIRMADTVNRDIPILALTAHALDDEIERFMAAGMSMCLTKPVSQNTLARALRDHLGAAPEPSNPETDVLVNHDTLGDLMGVFDQTRLTKMLDLFERELGALLDALPGLLADADFARIAELTHKSVGSSGLIGAAGVFEMLSDVEAAAKGTEADALERMLPPLKSRIALCIEALRRAVDDHFEQTAPNARSCA